MSEIEDRVARAIAAAILAQPRSGATLSDNPELTISDDDSNSFWRLIPVARAAIDAVLLYQIPIDEPTPEMTRAFLKASDLSFSIPESYDWSSHGQFGVEFWFYYKTFKTAYAAMMDAAPHR